MIRFLTISLALCLAAAGGHAQDEPEILGRSDIRTLNRAAQDWFEAAIAYEMETDNRSRMRRGQVMRKAREDFLRSWESKLRKGDILASIPDLRAVFANTFPFDRVSTSGEPKTIDADPSDSLVPAHVVVAPRRYDPRDAIRTVLMLPWLDPDENEWTRPSDYYEATWEDSSLSAETLLAMPMLDESIDFDALISPDQPNAEEIELNRNKLLLGTARGISRTFNVDFDRVFLDVGRGAGAFAPRFASYFPQLLAGLIIRHPVDVTEEIRLGSLHGMPVLLVSSEETKAACDALAATLNGMEPGSCTVIEGAGEPPFTDSQPEIDAWVEGVRRQLYRQHVVVEPNHDVFNDAYWVKMGTAEPLADFPRDQRARLEVKADREANRIDVSSTNVQDFTLLLNDAIVDLDEPFTVVINGTAFEETRQRSLDDLVDRMLSRRDPSYLFTAEYKTAVPRTDGDER